MMRRERRLRQMRSNHQTNGRYNYPISPSRLGTSNEEESDDQYDEESRSQYEEEYPNDHPQPMLQHRRYHRDGSSSDDDDDGDDDDHNDEENSDAHSSISNCSGDEGENASGPADEDQDATTSSADCSCQDDHNCDSDDNEPENCEAMETDDDSSEESVSSGSSFDSKNSADPVVQWMLREAYGISPEWISNPATLTSQLGHRGDRRSIGKRLSVSMSSGPTSTTSDADPDTDPETEPLAETESEVDSTCDRHHAAPHSPLFSPDTTVKPPIGGNNGGGDDSDSYCSSDDTVELVLTPHQRAELRLNWLLSQEDRQHPLHCHDPMPSETSFSGHSDSSGIGTGDDSFGNQDARTRAQQQSPGLTAMMKRLASGNGSSHEAQTDRFWFRPLTPATLYVYHQHSQPTTEPGGKEPNVAGNEPTTRRSPIPPPNSPELMAPVRDEDVALDDEQQVASPDNLDWSRGTPFPDDDDDDDSGERNATCPSRDSEQEEWDDMEDYLRENNFYDPVQGSPASPIAAAYKNGEHGEQDSIESLLSPSMGTAGIYDLRFEANVTDDVNDKQTNGEHSLNAQTRPHTPGASSSSTSLSSRSSTYEHELMALDVYPTAQQLLDTVWAEVCPENGGTAERQQGFYRWKFSGDYLRHAHETTPRTPPPSPLSQMLPPPALAMANAPTRTRSLSPSSSDSPPLSTHVTTYSTDETGPKPNKAAHRDDASHHDCGIQPSTQQPMRLPMDLDSHPDWEQQGQQAAITEPSATNIGTIGTEKTDTGTATEVGHITAPNLAEQCRAASLARVGCDEVIWRRTPGFERPAQPRTIQERVDAEFQRLVDIQRRQLLQHAETAAILAGLSSATEPEVTAMDLHQP